MIEVMFKKLIDDAILPEKGTLHSAGYDIVSAEEGDIKPGGRRMFKTGFSMALPENKVALICSRSGLAINHGIMVLNAPGVIDADFRGEITVILINTDRRTYYVKKGDRIAQMLIMGYNDIVPMVVNELPESIRGEGGFGSTGK